MTRPFVLFLAGVVLPVILAVAGAVVLREQEVEQLQEDAAARMARITGALLMREAALGSGTPPAAPSPESPGAPTVDRVRTVLRAVERWAGYRTAVYLDGARTWATDPEFGPDRLSPDVEGALERGEHAGAPGEIEQAAVVGLAGSAGTASLAVLAAPVVARSASLPLSNLLPVLTVAVILSAVAAWVLFRPSQAEREGGRPGRMQTALVVLIPILAGWALLGYLRRDLDRTVDGMTVRELSRAMALVRNRIPDTPVEEIRAVTGFDATRIDAGAVTETTLESPGLRAGLARSPSPPAGLPSSGRVQARTTGATYVAFRQPGRTVLVLTTPTPDPRVRLYSMLLWFLSVAIAVPGAAALLGGRLVGDESEASSDASSGGEDRAGREA